uniref:Glycosyl transferase WecB/TagA/CpsF n=1 Tax=Paulinella longichromatophora TaxID=1708747 RepID=A0A2H4ZPP3_9EUKA|nr:Glycosyl transferase WecB/TagA/CpsF [Paulinella longichromatophora]
MGVSPSTKTNQSVLGIKVHACKNVYYSALDLYKTGGGQIITLNAEMTMAARLNPKLREVIENAPLVIPDGAGIVWALSRQGIQVIRTPGIDLAYRLLQHAEIHGWKTALIGSRPEVIQILVRRLRKELPNLNLVFAAHGYQSVDKWTLLEKHLIRLNPDLILVALGGPHQEIWAMDMHNQSSGLWMGVGGSFDIWAGIKKRAPRWMGAFNLEWVYRLIQEPSRWNRMLVLPTFAWKVIVNTRS